MHPVLILRSRKIQKLSPCYGDEQRKVENVINAQSKVETTEAQKSHQSNCQSLQMSTRRQTQSTSTQNITSRMMLHEQTRDNALTVE